MSAGTTAYLVVRRDDGFGDVFPLTPGQSYTLGRAPTNRIVLKDDLCSREHAEIAFAAGRWRLRDLTSLNGTRVNNARLDAEWELSPNDEVHLGRTHLLFVEDMDQLPELPPAPPPPAGEVAIRKRLGQTRFLTPQPASPEGHAAASDATESSSQRHALSRDLSLLYRLALDMGSAGSYEDLCAIVLDALLEGVPADVGAILSVARGGNGRPAAAKAEAGLGVEAGKSLRGLELEVTAHRHRDPGVQEYTRVSEYVSNEVLASREAVLAEDVARDRYLRNRESLSALGATSLICAPILFGDRLLGLIHLYCTDPHKALDAEDLEFTVAVAKQLGGVIHQMQRQMSLTEENRFLRDQLRVESELVGASPAIKDVEQQIARVAGTNATCLIRG
jgi:Nif-specific regulatory protein